MYQIIIRKIIVAFCFINTGLSAAITMYKHNDTGIWDLWLVCPTIFWLVAGIAQLVGMGDVVSKEPKFDFENENNQS